jgi:cysteine synthase
MLSCFLFWSHISCDYAKKKIAIIMPDDVAEEKVKALRALGADVQRVRPASIVDKKQVRD